MGVLGLAVVAGDDGGAGAGGGRVDEGRGEVRAKTRAAAMESA